MRYILTDPQALELGELAKALTNQDPAYQLTVDENEGTLEYAGTTVGHLTLKPTG